MNGYKLCALLVLGLGATAQAAPKTSAGSEKTPQAETLNAAELPQYESVRSITALGGLHSFSAIDNDTLIVWTTPFRPYLIELAYPSVDLKFSHAIAIDSRTSRIHARFDSVRIRGINYPIREIYKLDRDQARQLRKT